MTFRLRLKRINKPKYTRLEFDLEKLKDPNVLQTFQEMIGGKLAPLTIMNNEHTDLDLMITTFNTAVTSGWKKTRQTKEEVERTTSGNGQAWSSQSPRVQLRTGTIEETGCKIICGAPTTLAVEG